MFCQHCGKQIQDGARFCPGCGAAQATPIQSAPVPAQPEPIAEPVPAPEVVAPASAPVPVPAETAAPAKSAVTKKGPPRWLILAVVILAIAAVWFFFIRTDPIKDVKEHLIHITAFADKSGSYPLGEIVELNLPDANWSSQEQGKDCYLVTVSGRYPRVFAGSANNAQDNTMITFTFSVQYIGGTPIVQLVSGGGNGGNVELRSLDIWLQQMAIRYQQTVSPQPQA